MAKRRIVASFITDEQEFQLYQAEDARAAARRAGLEIDVLFAEANPVLQIHQLFRFIHAPQDERPEAIVIEPVTEAGLERLTRNILRAGIGCVLINSRPTYLERVRREYPRLLVSAVATDQLEVGRIQARQFRALLPSGGHVLYVQGPQFTMASAERLRGMEEGIAGTRIRVTALTSDWTETGGEKTLTAWLQRLRPESPEPDVVGCQNDALALGARRALQKHRPEWAKLPTTGCDGLPDGGMRLVETGQLAATVVTPSNAGRAVDLVARFVADAQFPALETLLAPSSFPDIGGIAAGGRLAAGRETAVLSGARLTGGGHHVSSDPVSARRGE